MRNYFAQQQAQPQPQAQPVADTPLDPDLVLTDPNKWQEGLNDRINRLVDERVNAAVAPAYQGTSETARALSKSDPKLKTYWEKFGDQIDNLASNPQIDTRLKGSKTFWDNAARAIASQDKNLDTLVAERAASLAATSPGIERGGSGAGISSPEMSSLDKLKETNYGKRLSGRYSDAQLLAHIKDAGETLESFTAKAKDLEIQVNPDNPGEWTTPLWRNR